MLKWLKDPRVWIPLATLLAVVLLAGGSYLIWWSWLVAAIVALAVVLAVLVGVLVWLNVHQDQERRIERGTEDREAVEEVDERAQGRHALAALEDRFRRALQAIRSSQRGPRGIYQNPWYLVLGETGTGKSALISASGLELPAKFQSFVTHGPTENCDWWIMNEAVVLDTTGRYAEILDDTARKEWRRLLKLLRKARPKCPLNGVVLALSATTLLQRDEGTLIETAKELRRRLNEITDLLGVDVPIYVMVTQSDRIDGFLETARALPPNRVSEALGWTNPERRIANFEEAIGEGLSRVCSRLDDFLPELVLREADPLRRAKIFLFPQALKEVARAAQVFLGQLFQRAISEETPFLRGVYFLSSVQQGMTVSPLMEELGHGWAHAPASNEGRSGSFFVRDLFREVIVDPEEAGLARRTSRLGPLGTRILLVTGACVALLVSVWLTTSFALNLRAVGRLKQESEGVLAVTPTIRMLADLRDRIEQEAAQSTAFFHRAGLFGTTEHALERSRRTFVWAFEREYESPAKDRLVSIVRQGSSDRSFAALADLALDVSWLEATLRARAAAADGEEPDLPGGDFVPQLARYAPVAQNDVDQRQFQSGYEAFVRWLPDPDTRTRIGRERDVLSRVTSEILTIDQLESWAEGHGKPVRYSDVGIEPPPERDVPEVHPAYTRDTWEKLVAGLIVGVERTGGASEQAVDRFQQDYVERYDEEWYRFLIETPIEAVAQDEVAQSPYLALLQQIQYNGEAGIRREEKPGWLELLEEVHRTEDEGAPPAEGEQKAGPPWPRYQAALEKVEEEVASVDTSPEAALDLAMLVVDRKEKDAFSEGMKVVRDIVPIRRDRRAASKIQEILAMPIVGGYCAVLDSALAELDARWYDEIASESKFGPGAGTAELIQLYGRGGKLEKFRKENLEPFMNADDIDPLLEECKLDLGPQFLSWLEAAEGMELMVDGRTAASRVPVRLVGAPSRVVNGGGLYVTRRELRVSCIDKDHLFVYREGMGSYSFTWTPECTEVSLRVWGRRPGGGDQPIGRPLEWSGPLAFPSFLRSGGGGPGGSDRLKWTLSDGGARVIVEYEVRGGDQITVASHTQPPRSVRN